MRIATLALVAVAVALALPGAGSATHPGHEYWLTGTVRVCTDTCRPVPYLKFGFHSHYATPDYAVRTDAAGRYRAKIRALHAWTLRNWDSRRKWRYHRLEPVGLVLTAPGPWKRDLRLVPPRQR